MKKLFVILASATLFSISASAHDRCETRSRIVGYTHCGTPIIATLEVVGRTRCGEPIFDWVTHYPREADHRVPAHHEWEHSRYEASHHHAGWR
jgi:hypothetical protein